MQNQNPDLLLNSFLNAATTEINEINQATATRLFYEVYKFISILKQDIQSCKQQNQEILVKLDSFENQLQENQESINFIETEIPHLRHLVGKNEDLENRLAFLEPED
jgi:hypothetical protein